MQSFWAVGGQLKSGGGRVRYLVPARTTTVLQLVKDFTGVCLRGDAKDEKAAAAAAPRGHEKEDPAAAAVATATLGALSVVKVFGWAHPVLSDLSQLVVTPVERGKTLEAAGVVDGDVLEVVAQGHIPHEGSEFARRPPKGILRWL